MLFLRQWGLYRGKFYGQSSRNDSNSHEGWSAIDLLPVRTFSRNGGASQPVRPETEGYREGVEITDESDREQTHASEACLRYSLGSIRPTTRTGERALYQKHCQG